MSQPTIPTTKPTKPTQPKSPVAWFFALGDKVTSNPKQKAEFDYYMMIIIFLAFGFVFLGNLWQFFNGGYHIQNLGWAAFGLAIMWFQYFNLKMMYGMRQMFKNQPEVKIEDDEEEEEEEESFDDMLKGFEKKREEVKH